MWRSGPPRGAPGEVASPCPVGPAYFASDATHGVHGLFCVQHRKTGTQRQEEEVGQRVRARPLGPGREGRVTCCTPGPQHTSQGPGGCQRRKLVARLSPARRQQEEVSPCRVSSQAQEPSAPIRLVLPLLQSLTALATEHLERRCCWDGLQTAPGEPSKFGLVLPVL